MAIDFVLQSYLPTSGKAITVSARRQRRTLLAYAALCVVALVAQAGGDRLAAAGLGLVFPGAGFLHWATGGQAIGAFLFTMLAMAAFGAATAKWFATGNAVLPPLVWLAAAGLAAWPDALGLDAGLVQPAAGLAIPVPLLAALAATLAIRPRASATSPIPALAPAGVRLRPSGEEVSLDDLCRLRLLADRALQPVDRFDGFEWRDQFQTAAVRYQVNFIGYALALARRNYFPAATAWPAEAQARLLAKQGDPRLWRHWILENAWGNLRLGRDPIPRGNIMSTGFIGLQMALGETGGTLDLHRGGETWRSYGLDDMAAILARQYRGAPCGLLSCEPNWIYPLCNLITVCGLRATDARTGSAHWRTIADSFGRHLVDEFTGADRDFVAFRSSLTGFAARGVGGAVMQTFPCLFLNSLYPALAERHWQRARDRARARGWRRALWPIDVGNYGFSRAAGYTASAAAAVEMGDVDSAATLLGLLDIDCPCLTIGGVTHRARASLWSHALELTARLGASGGLRALIETPGDATAGPHLAEADYPRVLVAAARRDGDALRLVLHPGDEGGLRPIGVAGLVPGRHYRTGLASQPFARADLTGRAVIGVPLHARTELQIVPVI